MHNILIPYSQSQQSVGNNYLQNHQKWKRTVTLLCYIIMISILDMPCLVREVTPLVTPKMVENGMLIIENRYEKKKKKKGGGMLYTVSGLWENAAKLHPWEWVGRLAWKWGDNVRSKTARIKMLSAGCVH